MNRGEGEGGLRIEIGSVVNLFLGGVCFMRFLAWASFGLDSVSQIPPQFYFVKPSCTLATPIP